MKKIKNILLLGVLFSLVSCVSSKTFKEIEGRYAKLKYSNDALVKKHNSLTKSYDSLKVQQQITLKAKDSLSQVLETKVKELNEITEAYNSLESSSNEVLMSSIEKNQELLDNIQLKESELLSDRQELDSLRQILSAKVNKIEELEALVTKKEEVLKTLKNALTKSLLEFEGNGIKVEQKNGKIYVSLENKLLFQSGSWTVEKRGEVALNQLGAVLSKNPDIDILIEGHTDNQPYRGDTKVNGNWDLSTKRATSIVNILLKNKKINPKNITAAGRSEFHPLSTNKTPEGRADNRRTEIILTPSIDIVAEILFNQ